MLLACGVVGVPVWCCVVSVCTVNEVEHLCAFVCMHVCVSFSPLNAFVFFLPVNFCEFLSLLCLPAAAIWVCILVVCDGCACCVCVCVC